MAIRWLSTSRYSIVAEPARSTSTNTAPNPFTRPGVLVPTSRNVTSTWLLPTGMNSFLAEKAVNWAASPALTAAKLVLSTRSPVPGVEYSAPRFELTLKKFAGNVSTSVSAAGTPSQLISRRPLSAGGELGAFRTPPRAPRNSVSLSAIDTLSPSVSNTGKVAGGGGGGGVGGGSTAVGAL